MKARVSINVLEGSKSVTLIVGRTLELDLDTIVGEIIPLEHTLEKLTGLRYHFTLEEVASIAEIDRLLDEERRSR